MGSMRDAMKGAGLVTQQQIEESDAEATRKARELKEWAEQAARDNERRRLARVENEARLSAIRKAIEAAEKTLGPLNTATRLALFKLPVVDALMVVEPAVIMASLDGLVEGCTTNRDFALNRMREELGLEEAKGGRKTDT